MGTLFNITVVALVLVAAFVGYVAGIKRPRRPAPEPKIFGVADAESALPYLKTPEAEQAAKAVVFGVLGYKNLVHEQVTSLRAQIVTDSVTRDEEISAVNQELQGLRARIENLHQMNANAFARSVELEMVAERLGTK